MTMPVETQPLIRALEVSARKMDLATAAAASAGASVFARFIRKELDKGSHAKKSKTGSAAGEPPERVSGDLMRSVRVFTPKRLSMGRYEGAAGTSEFYGRFHEKGTKHEKPHPFVEPGKVAAETSGEVHEAVTKVWRVAAGL